jgi:micrococcal nuclease
VTNVRLLFNVTLLFLLAGAAVHAAPALQRERVHVTSVFDGDTIVVDRGGSAVTVRLIGVDTPETERPDTPVQFYGPEASAYTRTALQGREVWLEFEPPDRPGGSVDKYGRTLAYVTTVDGGNFNLELVRKGYGRVYARYPFTYQREFERAERSARAAGLGLWDKKQRAAWSDPARRGRIIGNIRSHIYHLPGQEGYTKVLEKNRIYFTSEEDAVKAGFRKARAFSGISSTHETVEKK